MGQEPTDEELFDMIAEVDSDGSGEIGECITSTRDIAPAEQTESDAWGGGVDAGEAHVPYSPIRLRRFLRVSQGHRVAEDENCADG